MALGDNFMWDPEGNISGETTDNFFKTLGAWEISSFSFGLVPEGGSIEEDKDEGGEGEASKNHGGKGLPTGQVKLAGGGAKPMRIKITKGKNDKNSAKPKFGTLTIEKFVDRASVNLYGVCATGTHVPTLCMAIAKLGGDAVLYLQYVFRDCQITGIAWKGGEGDKRAGETLTVEFKALGMAYFEQYATGRASKAAMQQFLWSLETIPDADAGPEERQKHTTLDLTGVDPPPNPIFQDPIPKTPKT